VFVPNAERAAPASIGLSSVKEIELGTPDGETLVAWRLDAQPGKPTILYFHGNAGNLASRSERVEAFRNAGYGMLMMAYRSYGGSSGSPSEENIAADAKLARNVLIRQGVPATQIIAYGESLGTGVATRLAAETEVAALILDAPYTALVDVAALDQPFLPVHQLLSDQFDLIGYIDKIGVPLLVMHGEADTRIPVRMGKAVFAAAKEPKALALFPKGQHSDLYEHGAAEAIAKFVEAHFGV